MGRIQADIALESWLFGFQPCLDLFGTVYPKCLPSCSSSVSMGSESMILTSE